MENSLKFEDYHESQIKVFKTFFNFLYSDNLHLHFYLLLKKATAVAETSNTIFLASVNFFIYLFIFFNMPGYTPNILCM